MTFKVKSAVLLIALITTISICSCNQKDDIRGIVTRYNSQQERENVFSNFQQDHISTSEICETFGQRFDRVIGNALEETIDHVFSVIEKSVIDCGLTSQEKSLLTHLLVQKQNEFSSLPDIDSSNSNDVVTIDVIFFSPAQRIQTHSCDVVNVYGKVYFRVMKCLLPEINNHIAIVSFYEYPGSEMENVRTSSITVSFGVSSGPETPDSDPNFGEKTDVEQDGTSEPLDKSDQQE